MKNNTDKFTVQIATAAHTVYAETICLMMEDSAKKRGTGIAKRKPEYIVEKMLEGGGGDQIFFRNPTVDFVTALSATVILIASGALAGYIPARKAASVKPIEALRDEWEGVSIIRILSIRIR